MRPSTARVESVNSESLRLWLSRLHGRSSPGDSSEPTAKRQERGRDEIRHDQRVSKRSHRGLFLPGLTNGSSLKQSVRDDLAVIKGSSLVRKELADRSYGFIYDIKTGLVSPLED